MAAMACGGEAVGPGPGPNGNGDGPVVASVEVSPVGARLDPGETVTLTATARDATGATVNGRAVSWASSNAAVAGVSTAGVVTGMAPGAATVTATVDGVSGAADVRVVLVVADDFERADGPLGPDWSVTRDNLEIVDGEVGMVALGATTLAEWQANTFDARQYSEVVVGSLGSIDFSEFRGLQVFVRMQKTGTPWRYGFHFFGNELVYQIKYDGGPNAETEILAETPVQPLPQPGDVFRVEATGSTITGYLNGQEILQVTDGRLMGGALGFAISQNLTWTTLPVNVTAAWNGGELK